MDKATCDTCKPGYGKVGQGCEKCTKQDCVNCDGDKDTCKFCIQGKTQASGANSDPCTVTCEDSAGGEFCTTCPINNSGDCSACADGYGLDDDKLCVKCTLEGCKECTA